MGSYSEIEMPVLSLLKLKHLVEYIVKVTAYFHPVGQIIQVL